MEGNFPSHPSPSPVPARITLSTETDGSDTPVADAAVADAVPAAAVAAGVVGG